ncbi:F-box/kelch-repeat protein [Raphanus sativus]|nr:F-box/kelch-repeat protein [Raphanus sativus]
MKKRICDLPPRLVGEKILSKVPITCVGEVRSTCKLWDRLTREWIVGGKEEAAKHQFLGFVTVDFKVCSLRFRKEEDAVDLSIKQVGLLNQYEVRQVFHCEGLLLCVLEEDRSKLLAWNPYLGQTRSISSRTGDDFDALDVYLFGYDMNRNHKMLRFHETFGLKPLHLPFLVYSCEEAVTLSSFRDEKLALLHQKGHEIIEALEIWITTKFDDQPFNAAAVTWSKFMNVDMRPLIGDRFVRFDEHFAGFFLIGSDEEEKVAVVFDMDGYEFCFELVTTTDYYHTAFIIGDDGYYKTVSLGVAPNTWKHDPLQIYVPTGYVPQCYYPPFVCSSSYLPSLVQLNNQPPRQRD